jgi:GH15 family glucan-1,4-alpha-glucosidase
MTRPIEDYALLGDGQTAALVARDGSIDWLCLPRFDSPTCFAALLGGPAEGRFLLTPKGEPRATRRRYRGDTLVLETDYETPEGAVTVVDALPIRDGWTPHVMRVVEGRSGAVPMRMELVLRFDYGAIVPWVRTIGGELRATGGRDAVRLVTPVPVRGEDMTSVADFTVHAGERVPFVLSWHLSYEAPPPRIDALRAIDATVAWWERWSRRCRVGGQWRDPVVRSLITLKALADSRTGGIVAAPTTSLPEEIGGERNWDYRYCWIRDATLTLLAFLHAGYTEEAKAWGEWLLRAVAGDPSALQTMYGVGGERRLTEVEVASLPGYGGSRPVRIGNAASLQLQIDVFGELADCMYHWRTSSVPRDDASWSLELAVMGALERVWSEADEGIWEVRGGRHQFTHSKVMAWVAFDRAIKTVERFGARGPEEEWRRTRQAIFEQVCREGFDPRRNAFTQRYGSPELDAALLMIPLVGFLPPTDPRVVGTVQAIERELVVDGFVRRYASEGRVDGLRGTEGAFLPCSFWLADCLAIMGRREEASALFERLLAVRNDVGLLAEEYDPRARRLLGNFPQAFSHVALIHTALHLTRDATVSTRAA